MEPEKNVKNYGIKTWSRRRMLKIKWTDRIMNGEVFFLKKRAKAFHALLIYCIMKVTNT